MLLGSDELQAVISSLARPISAPWTVLDEMDSNRKDVNGELGLFRILFGFWGHSSKVLRDGELGESSIDSTILSSAVLQLLLCAE